RGSAWRQLKERGNESAEGSRVSPHTADRRLRVCRDNAEAPHVHHLHVAMVCEKPVWTFQVELMPRPDHDALLGQIQHYQMDHY
ncbi:cation transporter, partial [Escherichia coli]|nr:cation transporter [Escherichia coli]